MKRPEDVTAPVVACIHNLTSTASLPDGSEELGTLEAVRVKLLVHNYARKLRTSGSLSDREIRQRSFDIWSSNERRCEQTTARLNSATGAHVRFLWRVQDLITSVIGPCPPIQRILRDGGFSGGASFKTRRGTHFSRKLECLQITPPLRKWALAFVGLTDELEVVRGARMEFVPKTNEVHRPIGVEPSGNVFFQKAVGNHIRRRLRTVGIDLDDQTRNQQLAFEAYADDLATIDLESASDSISLGLVSAVLPPAWFELLDDLRSHEIRIDKETDQWRELSKFSAMGNGFTFELESLIFWAICKAVLPSESVLGVYGDDIIIPQRYARPVINALEFCGFKTNESKSFISGSFFESCGKYYYKLEDVTPIFQKEAINSLPSAFRAYNRLVRWGLRCNLLHLCFPALEIIKKAFPSIAKVPYGAERDDGYLTPRSKCRMNRHGDYICIVRHSVSLTDDDVNEINAYRYKLYKSGHANEDPRGHPVRDTGRFSCKGYRRTVIWASSLSS